MATRIHLGSYPNHRKVPSAILLQPFILIPLPLAFDTFLKLAVTLVAMAASYLLQSSFRAISSSGRHSESVFL